MTKLIKSYVIQYSIKALELESVCK